MYKNKISALKFQISQKMTIRHKNLLFVFDKLIRPFPGILTFVCIISFALPASAADTTKIVLQEKSKGCFALFASGQVAPFCVSPGDYPGVIRAVHQLRADLYAVTGAEPALLTGDVAPAKAVVLAGTLGKNPLIDRLVHENKLDTAGIADRWETFLIQVVEKPFTGIKQALVIAGSDKRGTIYGIYELSSQIGVSPWYWWADVPVAKQKNLYVLPGRHTLGEPAVKYRGIFINDEAPALSDWAYEKFGGFNHAFYEKVFELILRLKGNFLWPAMWGRAFYDDDTLNPILADEYGIVIGTSHHEPMMRAHDEWRRYGSGPWNYELNEDKLKAFWREGIERMGSNESIVTIGMRGDGDEPMTEGTAIALLERIVRDQRKILEEVTGKNASKTPQMWALYKEVQDYYDKGMRVPDDVTLLLCDDNWGNIRKLPSLKDSARAGGYGIYYHFDYVGGPRNYKWLNTNQIERVWEQMHLAYQYGADRVWIVNVGDIKPMELPIEFFLDYAWDPGRWTAERLPEYYRLWVREQFEKSLPPVRAPKGSGNKYYRAWYEQNRNNLFLDSIADILAAYTRFNSRRKPELLSPETYSLINYREAEMVVNDYNKLAAAAGRFYDAFPFACKDAFYQLVLFPVKASANLNELYVTAGKNHLYARQKRSTTDRTAVRVRELFRADSAMTDYFHTRLAGGKWNHMMSQTHIGYTGWQQPEQNSIPEVREITVPDKAAMGVAIEGSESWWPEEKDEAVLPVMNFCHQKDSYVEVFNQGTIPFEFHAQADAAWLTVHPSHGIIADEKRLWVRVDWLNVPEGVHHIPITITGPDSGRIIVQAVIDNSLTPDFGIVREFIETNGYVSMEAADYTRALGEEGMEWATVPNLGRTLSGVTAIPDFSLFRPEDEHYACIHYYMQMSSSGKVKVKAYFSPTLNFSRAEGLRYGISFDNESPQIVNVNEDKSLQGWEQSVADNIRIITTEHFIDQPGKHILYYRLIDPGLVLQKIVVETGEPGTSYLGPPESCKF